MGETGFFLTKIMGWFPWVIVQFISLEAYNTIRFHWLRKTFVKVGWCKQPFRTAVSFTLPRAACGRVGFREPLPTSDVHSEDVVLDEGEGLGTWSKCNPVTESTPQTPLLCTVPHLSFNACF